MLVACYIVDRVYYSVVSADAENYWNNVRSGQVTELGRKMAYRPTKLYIFGFVWT